MSLMSLLAASHLLPEEKRKKTEEDIADLERETQGIHADLRAIEQDPVRFYISRFCCGMERMEELGPRETANLTDKVEEWQDRLAANARRIAFLRERL